MKHALWLPSSALENTERCIKEGMKFFVPFPCVERQLKNDVVIGQNFVRCATSVYLCWGFGSRSFDQTFRKPNFHRKGSHKLQNFFDWGYEIAGSHWKHRILPVAHFCFPCWVDRLDQNTTCSRYFLRLCCSFIKFPQDLSRHFYVKKEKWQEKSPMGCAVHAFSEKSYPSSWGDRSGRKDR